MSPALQLLKVNKGRFSNPKRLLKPLLICLPFCFVCSAQVKGNLTFGILTANNPTPRTGMACCSVSIWLARMVGTLHDTPAICRGPQKARAGQTPWPTTREPPGTVSYPRGRAALNSLASSTPCPGRGDREMLCWAIRWQKLCQINERTQPVKVARTGTQCSCKV